MKTFMAKCEDVERKWVILDADGQVLGRLATRIADILRGKNRADYTPHVCTGDNVIVINAAKVRLTGNKLEDKVYYTHSGFPGGLRSKTAGDRMEQGPEGILYDAVKGMLPKNKLSRDVMTRLKIYKDANHPHEAQKPESIAG